MAAKNALIVAAPASGSGKTVITLALLRHFRDSGTKVSSFKIGPDYIDPAFHRAASGSICVTLDGWAMRPATLDALVAAACAGTGLLIGEGVMGLFDGAAGGGGSTADMAAAFGWPVVLVVDVRGQAASAAAVVDGFRRFRDDVEIAGVIFNRIGGENHERALRDACAAIGVNVLGCVPTDPALALPDRHLGLVQAGEHSALDEFIQGAAAVVARRVDMDALADLAVPVGPAKAAPAPPVIPPLGQRIAVARDEGFAFAYPCLFEGWRSAGAEILPFSPLGGEAPDGTADAVYLPGGYPELHAAAIAANQGFLDALRDAAARGAVVFGECGGYMVLGEGLVDGAGRSHAMAGLLPLETSFADAKLRLGYRQVRLVDDGPLGNRGAQFRGHEFHYAGVLREVPGEGPGGPTSPLFECRDSRGESSTGAGLRRGTVMGSFVHLIDAV
jgi:cobyrinic acid a,c-diamide synthase